MSHVVVPTFCYYRFLVVCWRKQIKYKVDPSLTYLTFRIKQIWSCGYDRIYREDKKKKTLPGIYLEPSSFVSVEGKVIEIIMIFLPVFWG